MTLDGGDFDAVVVGASISGSTVATLLGRAGLRVALIEAAPKIDAFKRPCGHFVQSSATPTLQRLDVTGEIERAGGVRNSVAIWSRRGWVHPQRSNGNGNGTSHRPEHGYTIRREKLDPILRARAAGTENVELMLGMKATAVADEPGAPVKVTVADRSGREREVRGQLLVAADGRNSAIGKLAGSPARDLLNRRFMYLAYFEDTPGDFGQTGQLWFNEPDMAYAYPTDDGLTLMACSVTKDQLPAFKRDREASFRRAFQRLPLAPQPDPRKQVTPFIGKLDMTNKARAASRGRIAFVGDSALTPDPSWAVGGGWALRAGEWLADAVAGPLLGSEPLEAGLKRYRKEHRTELGPTFLAIASYSLVRPMLPSERLLLRGAARDRVLAETLHDFGSGNVPAWVLFSPRTLGRAAWASARGHAEQVAA